MYITLNHYIEIGRFGQTQQVVILHYLKKDSPKKFHSLKISWSNAWKRNMNGQNSLIFFLSSMPVQTLCGQYYYNYLVVQRPMMIIIKLSKVVIICRNQIFKSYRGVHPYQIKLTNLDFSRTSNIYLMMSLSSKSSVDDENPKKSAILGRKNSNE